VQEEADGHHEKPHTVHLITIVSTIAELFVHQTKSGSMNSTRSYRVDISIILEKRPLWATGRVIHPRQIVGFQILAELGLF
jgi:hypothetical protein